MYHAVRGRNHCHHIQPVRLLEMSFGDTRLDTAHRLLSLAAGDRSGGVASLSRVVEIASDVLSDDGNDGRALGLRALAHYALGDVDAARADVRRSIALGRDEGDAAFILGAEGLPYLRKLLERPKLSSFRRNTLRLHLASIQLDLGLRDDAIATLLTVDLSASSSSNILAAWMGEIRRRAFTVNEDSP